LEGSNSWVLKFFWLKSFCSGQLLAAAGSDNKVRVISSYSSKTVHHYLTSPPDEDETLKSKSKVTCIGWGVNFTDKKAAQGHLEDSNGRVSIDDLLAPDTHPAKATVLLKANLPRELALLDVESSLPKLSVLPGTGSE
jgi:anaphase-promoting complex subunit 4